MSAEAPPSYQAEVQPGMQATSMAQQPQPTQGYQPQPQPGQVYQPQPVPVQGYQPQPVPVQGYQQQPMMQGYQPQPVPMQGYQPQPMQGYQPQPMMQGYPPQQFQPVVPTVVTQSGPFVAIVANCPCGCFDVLPVGSSSQWQCPMCMRVNFYDPNNPVPPRNPPWPVENGKCSNCHASNLKPGGCNNWGCKSCGCRNYKTEDPFDCECNIL